MGVDVGLALSRLFVELLAELNDFVSVFFVIVIIVVAVVICVFDRLQAGDAVVGNEGLGGVREGLAVESLVDVRLLGLGSAAFVVEDTQVDALSVAGAVGSNKVLAVVAILVVVVVSVVVVVVVVVFELPALQILLEVELLAIVIALDTVRELIDVARILVVVVAVLTNLLALELGGLHLGLGVGVDEVEPC